MSNQAKEVKNTTGNRICMSIRYCMRLSWLTSKLYTVLELLLSVLLTILPFTTLYLSKSILDQLVYQSDRIALVVNSIIGMTLIGALSTVLRQWLNCVQTVHGELMQFYIQEGIVRKSMTMDMEFFDSSDYLDAMQAVKNNAAGLPSSMWNILACVNCSISAVYSFILLSNVSVIAAFVVGVISIPAAIVNKKFAKKLFECRLSLTPESRMLGYLQAITSHKTYAADIRLFDLSDEFALRYRGCSRKIIQEEKKVFREGVIAKSATGIVPQCFVCFVLIALVHSISEGHMTVGDYSLYSGLLSTLVASISQFINAVIGIYEDRLKILKIEEFEARPNAIADTGNLELAGIHDIEFRDVSFCYPSATRATIKGLSFRIHEDEKICIVGVNGAGKSTLIKLLLRFYDVSSGEILINGRNIKEYSLCSLRKCFSTMFQMYDKYAFSLRDNIVLSDLSRGGAIDENVRNALSMAGGDDVLEKVYYNLDVPLSKVFDSTGIELSGGEIQRIGLARALYRQCSVIILDEPSAALDPFAENQLLESMMNNTDGKIVIFTAHRFSTVSLADRVLVLEDGTLVESGTHEELLHKRGKYADLYMAQAQKYDVVFN